MKSFLITSFCLIVMVSSWIYFCHYSEQQLDSFAAEITSEIIPDAENGNWDKVIKEVSSLQNNWENYKDYAHHFFRTDNINEIDFSFVRINEYMYSREAASLTNELAFLSKQLQFLHENEQLSLANLL